MIRRVASERKPYPEYKPSSIDWLGDMPEHWEVRRLKYTASINDEAIPETTDPDYGFNYVDIGNVDAVKGIVAKEVYRFETAPSRARRIVRDGDTIVSTVRTYLRAIAGGCWHHHDVAINNTILARAVVPRPPR